MVLVALLRRAVFQARWSAGLTFAFVVLLAVVPLGNVMLGPLEGRYPTDLVPEQVDGIVVLGGAEDAATARWRTPQLNEDAERFTEAVALARQFPDAELLFTGGSSDLRDGGNQTPGSTVAKAFLLRQGLNRDRLLFEDASRNTAENARLSLELADPDEIWVLVT